MKRLRKNGETAKLIMECVMNNFTVKDIVEMVGTSRSAVAVHLQNLLKAGYLKRRELGCPYEVTENGKKILN